MSEFIGIDVSKATLDIHLYHAGRAFSAANEEEALEELACRLMQCQPQLIVLEATGGYERLCTAALAKAGLPVVVVNPREVRAFAVAIKVLAKSDKVDARVLAHFAATIRPPIRELPGEQRAQLEEIMARRRQLIGMLVQEKNRLQQARTPSVKKEIKEHISFLHKRLRDCDAQLQQFIHDSSVWKAQEDLLRSCKGIGPVNASMMIAALPELGRLKNKQISSLVGVAPIANESGTRRGKRSIAGGRAHIRSVLYMATVAAIRCNDYIRAFYQRLRNAGKPAKVALIACMRKLLTILNAMMRTQTPWRDPLKAD